MSNIIFKTNLLKGEAGNNIQSIEKTDTSGLVDTYTITLTDGTTTTFEVTNGSNIARIEKTATEGLVDTYTITLTNGDTTNFEVTNGNDIVSIEKTATEGLVDTYTITYKDNTTYNFTITNSDNSAINQEAQTRASADESLRKAIDALVSPNGQSIVIDSSLTMAGAGADAKATGNAINGLEGTLDEAYENAFKGYIVNPNNILKDYKLESAIALDDATEILDGDFSKIIHISNTDGELKGASFDLGALFNPIITGKYYVHFKCKCIRNSAYASQVPAIYFYMYFEDRLKGSRTQIITTPSANAKENDYIEYIIEVDVNNGTTSNFDTFRIYSDTKFDFWIKDVYITRDDTLAGYANKYATEDYVKEQIESPIRTNLKLGIIGDSISDSSVHFAEKWHKYLHDKNGYTINCVAVSGSGYFNGSISGGTRDHQFYNQANLLDSDCDIVLIFGGLNDVGRVKEGATTIGTKTDSGTTTIGGCINTTIQNILAVNPLVHIGVIMPTPWEGLNPKIPQNNDYYEGTIGLTNLIKEICEYNSIPCLDLFHNSGLRPWIQAFKNEYYIEVDGEHNDGTHPNANGHEKFLYPQIREFLRGLNWNNL